MPSDTYARSIRTLLLVIVFQLGICIIVLGDVAAAARGYSETLSGVAQILGGVTAAGALLALLLERVSTDDTDDTPA